MTITFRSQDLHADGLHLQLVSGFREHADVRGEDWVVPSAPGQVEGDRVSDVRTLRLVGYISALTPEEWGIATDTLMALCDPTLASGELVLSDGYLGLEAGVEATINARCRNALGGPIEMGKLFQRWDIELFSLDPNWVIEESV